MDLKQGRKIGFWSALSISLGSVVGIGIFLKNISVIKNLADGTNSFNFIGLIVSWVLAAIISLLAAYSFSEIATSKQSKSGLAGWVEVLGGRKQGLFLKIAHSQVYYSLFVSLLPTIAIEGLFYAFDEAFNDVATMHFGWVFLGGFLVFACLVTLNYFALHLSTRLQFVGTVIKLIPLLVVIVVGLIGANSSHILNDSSAVVDGVNISTGLDVKEPVTSNFNLSLVIIVLPSILFSFDSFLTVGNLAKDSKKPEKHIPLVAIVTIVVAAIIYVLISIGAGLTGMGSAGDILKTLFPNNDVAAKTVDIIINVFITISAIFVVNALLMAGLKSCEGLIEAEEVMFFRFFQKLDTKKENLGTLVLFLIQSLFYMVLFCIPAVIMNNDAIFDIGTTAPSLIFFLIYAYTMVLGIRDRFTKKRCKVRVKGFLFTAPIASLLIIALFVYLMIYQYIILAVTDFTALSGSGVFYSENGATWYRGDDAIVLWVIFIWSFLLPTINYFVLKKQTKSDSKNADLFIPYHFKLQNPFKWTKIIKKNKQVSS